MGKGGRVIRVGLVVVLEAMVVVLVIMGLRVALTFVFWAYFAFASSFSARAIRNSFFFHARSFVLFFRVSDLINVFFLLIIFVSLSDLRFIDFS